MEWDQGVGTTDGRWLKPPPVGVRISLKNMLADKAGVLQKHAYGAFQCGHAPPGA